MENKKLYETYNNGEHWKNHSENYALSFVEFLKSKNKKVKILDVGCGDGRDLRVFEKEKFDSYGIDILKREIDEIKKRDKKSKVFVENAEKLSFEDESFDAVFMINVIHYLKKKEALSEVLRILKKDGYFLIHFNLKIRRTDGTMDYEEDEENILGLLNGFNIVRKEYFTRIDKEPIPHEHSILSLILQKP